MRKLSFLQDWGIFKNETFVCVGMSRMEILLEMYRLDFQKVYIREFEKENRPKSDGEDPAAAFIWTCDGVSLLWFADWKADLEHYGDLLHETNHLVFEMSRDCGYRDEREAQAYLQQYLWLNILKKFNREFCVKSKRNKREDAKDKDSQRADGGVQSVHTGVQTEREAGPQAKGPGGGNTGRLYSPTSRGGTWRGRAGEGRPIPTAPEVRCNSTTNR